MTARDFLRRRLMARYGLTEPDLPLHSVVVGEVTRTFVAAPGPDPTGPLLLVLHGAGGTGAGMAALSGLHERGPAKGCTVLFPDGVAHVWNDNRATPRLRRREGVDDVALLCALVEHARRSGVNEGRQVFAVGMSNGGLLAEHVARHGLVELAGIVLVAAGATMRSRASCPVPRQASGFLAFHGTADPLVPYRGGPIGLRARPPRRRPGPAGRGSVAPMEEVAADWCQDRARGATPTVERLEQPAGDLPVDRLRWPGAPGAARTPGPTLYRIMGGGHTWPGGKPYLPTRIIGPVAQHLDATGLILDFVRVSPSVPDP
ncbi:MAG TPA: hypothetical protein VEG62_07590 [Acidimicrobiales bacterium]|nr:hypothetical protein [Acidimicrobiales bacterium]